MLSVILVHEVQDSTDARLGSAAQLSTIRNRKPSQKFNESTECDAQITVRAAEAKNIFSYLNACTAATRCIIMLIY
jgi:hypothetical protein